MSRRSTVFLWFVAVAAVISTSDPVEAFDYSAYVSSSLAEAYSTAYAAPEADFTIDSRFLKYKVRVTATGQRRKIGEPRLDFLTKWSKSLKLGAHVAALFEYEVEVRAEGQSYWIPIQTSLIEAFEEEVPVDTECDLFILYAGAQKADKIFLINEFRSFVGQLPATS